MAVEDAWRKYRRRISDAQERPVDVRARLWISWTLMTDLESRKERISGWVVNVAAVITSAITILSLLAYQLEGGDLLRKVALVVGVFVFWGGILAAVLVWFWKVLEIE